MTIISVTESIGRELTVRGRLHSHTRKFLVTSDTLRESEAAILKHKDIPSPLVDFHDQDGTAICTEVKPSQRKTGYHWDVVAEYSGEFLKEDKNPLKRPAEISLRSEQTTQIARLDIDDRPITNTAGDYFADPPVEIEGSRWVLSVTKNLAQYPRWLLDFQNAVNDGAIRIEGITWPKRTLMLKELEIPPPQTENKRKFFAVRFALHYRAEGWDVRILNRGVREIIWEREEDEDGNAMENYVNKGIREILENDGSGQVSEPVFLDEYGQAYRHLRDRVDDPKHPTGLLRNPTKNEIFSQIQVYHVYSELPFSRLPLK